MAYVSKLPDPSMDGVDHVNIYSGGKTEVGRWMSNFTRESIEIDGKAFASIEGYWFWLACYDDRLCDLSGFAAKKLGKELSPRKVYHEDEQVLFHDKIKVALALKCAKRPDMVEQIKNIKVPLTHYYVMRGQVRLAGFEWLVNFWEGIQGLKNN